MTAKGRVIPHRIVGKIDRPFDLKVTLGRARLVDVVPPRPEFLIGGVEAHYPPSAGVGGWRWHMREQFGFVLADIKPIDFIPCKGALGFFDVPAEAREALARIEEKK